MTGLPDERLAEIRADDQRMVTDLGKRVPWHGDPFELEGTGTLVRRALIDRRELLAAYDEQSAEIKRLRGDLERAHEELRQGWPKLARDANRAAIEQWNRADAAAAEVEKQTLIAESFKQAAKDIAAQYQAEIDTLWKALNAATSGEVPGD